MKTKHIFSQISLDLAWILAEERVWAGPFHAEIFVFRELGQMLQRYTNLIFSVKKKSLYIMFSSLLPFYLNFSTDLSSILQAHMKPRT